MSKITRRTVCAGLAAAPAALAGISQFSAGTGSVPTTTAADDVIARVIDVVSRYSGVSKDDMLSTLRTRDVVAARQKGLYLAYKLSGKSLPEIGRRFGGRDHTTVLHAARKWQGLSDTDAFVRSELVSLARLIRTDGDALLMTNARSPNFRTVA